MNDKLNFILPKNINALVIHCSDTDDNFPIEAIDIHKMHLNFGWDGIGYHKVICRNGIIQNGRPEFWVGAHVKSKNTISLGVCLIGRNSFTPEQFVSLEKVLRAWKKQYGNIEILGHRDIVKTNKTCPNFDVRKWCEKVGLI